MKLRIGLESCRCSSATLIDRGRIAALVGLDGENVLGTRGIRGNTTAFTSSGEKGTAAFDEAAGIGFCTADEAPKGGGDTSVSCGVVNGGGEASFERPRQEVRNAESEVEREALTGTRQSQIPARLVVGDLTACAAYQRKR